MKSLFIISLPRSLSSQIYRMVPRKLGLATPSWALDGEILNLDNFFVEATRRVDSPVKFTTRDRDPIIFQQVTDLLEHCTHAEGFAYKDVVQPFVLSEWSGLSRFNVLRIQRDIAEVALAMLGRGWHHPQAAGNLRAPIEATRMEKFAGRFAKEWYRTRAAQRNRENLEWGMIEGLVHAERALQRVPGQVVYYDELVAGPASLQRALMQLYPDISPPSFEYHLAERFRRRSEEILARRATPPYRRLAAIVKQVSSQPN